MQVTFNISDSALLTNIDRVAEEHGISRSRFISDCLHTYFEPKEPISVEVNLLKKDIEHLNELLARQERELNEARDRSGEYWLLWKEANDRLTMYQLPAPKPRRGFFAWLTRKKE